MGVFIKILPIIISILLLSSLFEAFYFLPLHAKDFLKVQSRKDISSSWWRSLKEGYTKVLGFLLRFKKSALMFFLFFSIFSTYYMFKISKFQLFPDFDNTQIYINGKVDINKIR